MPVLGITRDGQKLEKPLFTPSESTKAEQDAHDENVLPEQGSKSIDLLNPSFP
jgi:phosphoribosylaminoimidazole-succinocarboxamide synthase